MELQDPNMCRTGRGQPKEVYMGSGALSEGGALPFLFANIKTGTSGYTEERKAWEDRWLFQL